MPHQFAAKPIWRYNAALLAQAVHMIERLQREARPDFSYPQAVGPHVRHLIDHYSAFLRGLRQHPRRIEYDVRSRDKVIQSQPCATIAKLKELEAQLETMAQDPAAECQVDTLVEVVSRAGCEGALEVAAQSTVGRELMFLSSHMVHHFALLAHYCKAAGVDLGPDLGKAPGTVAFERREHESACA